MPTEKDLLSAIAFCANSENHFPRYDEGCRGNSCPLHPFCADGHETCSRCIERVLNAALNALKRC